MNKGLKSLFDNNIIVIDDTRLMREILKGQLKEFGFDNVTVISNAKDAYIKIQETTYDLVLCDWNMPGLTGMDLLKRLRNEELTKDILFIMVTADHDIKNVREALKSHVSDFLIKPIDPNVLLEKITALLGPISAKPEVVISKPKSASGSDSDSDSEIEPDE